MILSRHPCALPSCTVVAIILNQSSADTQELGELLSGTVLNESFAIGTATDYVLTCSDHDCAAPEPVEHKRGRQPQKQPFYQGLKKWRKR